jgi:hypothetical protein
MMKLTRRWGMAASRRGLVLVLAIVALIVLITLGLLFVRVGTASIRNAAIYEERALALNLAEAGVDECVWMMMDSTSGVDNINVILRRNQPTFPASYGPVSPRELERGEYWFEVSKPAYDEAGVPIPQTVEIHAHGKTKSGTQEDIRCVGKWLPTISAVFGHALFSGHDLRIGGSSYINGRPEVGGQGMYADGNIQVIGNKVSSRGDVTATGDVTKTYTTVDGEVKRFSGQIPMPAINLAYFRSIATNTFTGDQTFHSSDPWGGGGTIDNPKVIFVDGFVTINGNFSGTATIVATKGFKINGNIDYSDPGSALALLTPGNVRINGTASVKGLIYAHDVTADATFVGTGTADIVGGVVADVIDVNGNLNVTYDPRLKNINGLPGSEGQVDVISWEQV